MAKINNVRLPDAANSATISPGQFNQLVRSLEQIIQQLNSTYGSVSDSNKAELAAWFSGPNGSGGGFSGGLRGFQLSNGIMLPHAMLISNVDQANASTTGENLLTYSQVLVSNGVRVVNNSRIYMPCRGQYLITFSLQVSNRSNAVREFEVWAKATGVNFPESNTRYDIQARKSSSVWAHIVPTITGIFTINDPLNDYLEIAWWSDSLDVFIEHYPAQSSPTRPAIPSVILTVSFVSSG
jgi:hypothetical protein